MQTFRAWQAIIRLFPVDGPPNNGQVQGHGGDPTLESKVLILAIVWCLPTARILT